MWNSFRSSPGDDKELSGSYSRISVSEEPDGSELIEPFPSLVDDTEEFRREQEEDADDEILRPGDHVYAWRSFGVPRAYQRHAIILSVDPLKENDPDSVIVVSFYHGEGQEQEASNTEQYEPSVNQDDHLSSVDQVRHSGNSMAVKKESLKSFCQDARIHKVQYGSGVVKRLLSRAGTVTACKADERGLVLARVRYLVNNPTKLPKHHMLSANGECAAVWCKIGRWCTLQGSSILHIMFVGQAGGAAAGGFVASNLFLWTPMPGYWGAIGFWWYVPATLAYPVIVPLLVTFGLMSLVPLEILRRYRKKWKAVTFSLNHDFWLTASDDVKNEYFGSSESADEDWLKEFFGMDKEETEKGKYMPLNTEGNDEDDDEDDGILERHRENVAAAFQMDEGAGKPSAHQNLFLQQMDMMKQKWNLSWSNYTTKIRGGPSSGSEEDAAVPLTTEGSKRREGMGPTFRHRSWTGRSGGGLQKENVLQKFSKSWTNRNAKERRTSLNTIKLDTSVLDEDEGLLL